MFLVLDILLGSVILLDKELMGLVFYRAKLDLDFTGFSRMMMESWVKNLAKVFLWEWIRHGFLGEFCKSLCDPQVIVPPC